MKNRLPLSGQVCEGKKLWFLVRTYEASISATKNPQSNDKAAFSKGEPVVLRSEGAREILLVVDTLSANNHAFSFRERIPVPKFLKKFPPRQEGHTLHERSIVRSRNRDDDVDPSHRDTMRSVCRLHNSVTSTKRHCRY